MLLAMILGFAILAGVGSAAAAGGLLFIREEARRRWVPRLIAYSAGTMLGEAFLGMIPRAIEDSGSVHTASATLLCGMLVFFVLEQLVRWHHCHENEPGHAQHSHAGPLLLMGDALHNFVDGVAIASAFLTSVPIGIATTLAIAVHEVPQEVGDFAVLIHSGYTYRRAFLFNVLSNSAAVLGALLGWLFLPQIRGAVPYVLALSAASFIYIAAADLLPELHRQERTRRVAATALLLVGVATIVALHAIAD